MALGYRSLIIDDDLEILTLMQEYLRLEGYDPVTAENGEEAVALLQDEAVDLILLDIQMPRKDGFQTLQELGDHPQWREIPVIMLSSFDRPNLKVKALERGAEDYVTKPFDRAELLARIKVVLRRSQRFRQIEQCFHGDLDDIPLAILLQTMALSSKSAVIRLIDLEGTITVVNGEFAGAQFKQFEGKDALLRLVFGAQGTFDIEFEKVPYQGLAASVPIDELLMEVATVIDEVTAELAGVIDPAAHLQIHDGSILNGTTVSARRALVELPGNLFDNTRHLARSIQEGRCSVVEEKR